MTTHTETPTSAPTDLDLALRPDDPRTVFARAVDTGTSVIGQVRPDQLGDPTACTEFDVRALLGHLVSVLRRVAALGRGDNPFGPDVECGPVGDDGWLEAWSDAAHDVQSAWWDDAVLGRTMRLPWIEDTGASVLTRYLNEVTVHTWDLATATGQRPAWDPEVVALAFDAIRFLAPTGRAQMFAAMRDKMPPERQDDPDPFADAVPVPDDAPLIDRLVAWNGRRP